MLYSTSALVKWNNAVWYASYAYNVVKYAAHFQQLQQLSFEHWKRLETLDQSQKLEECPLDKIDVFLANVSSVWNLIVFV